MLNLITTAPPKITSTLDLDLRQYQSEAISQTYQHFESGLCSVLLYAPTGAGKTIIASKIIADYVRAGKRVLFMVHRGKLVRQTLDKLSKYFGIEAGVIWGDYYAPDYSKPVQIAMLQTIRNRELPPDIDLVILDEAHTGAYFQIWRQIMDKYSGGIWVLSKTKFLGLSASPWRAKNDQGYCQFFQTIVKAPYPKQLIEMGHLCRARQFAFTNLIDESKLKVVNGEYTEKSMADVCTPALNSEIVKLYLEKDPDLKRKLIAFCASVKQASDLAHQFSSVGVEAECIVGETPENEREEIFSKFSSGAIKLISSVGVLTEGFDEASVTSILVCRPVKSKALWVQMNGRGLRPMNGKSDCWFLDFCGNLKRLGLPTYSFPLVLCPDPKPIAPIATKTCPQCSSEIAIYEKVCPHCGFIFDSGSKKAKAIKRKFEEILSPEQQKHVRFLKNRAVNAFNKRKPIDDLDSLFFEEFGYEAPSDWYDGLIFGHELDAWEVYVQHYWRYLLVVTSNPGSTSAKSKMQQLIEREFKSAIQYAKDNFRRSYSEYNASRDNIEVRVSESIKKLIDYQPWWVIIGSTQPPDAHSIIYNYEFCKSRYELRFTDKPHLLEAYMELLGMAIAEGIEYHTQDQSTIDKHIYTIKHSIATSTFKFVRDYVQRLDLTIKQRVWASLSQEEKQAYRKWQDENPVQTAENKPNSSVDNTNSHSTNIKKDNNVNAKSHSTAIKGNSNVTTAERTNTKSPDTGVAKNTHTPVVKVATQLNLFTLAENSETKAANDIYNPLRLQVGDVVASNNPNNQAYNWCGQIVKIHPSDPRLCYVSYPERQKLLNLKSNETWCRFVDLRRV
ncbi:DEAD/DEAH box helicase [Dulcicalothrix desertica]|nr:DEAD/DEAH box helicase [Dulcicalothrix desertica]TWH43709.1 superfamily II DNA or RNA helicase [Dulcicalothrix desertica PCC 7102]